MRKSEMFRLISEMSTARGNRLVDILLISVLIICLIVGEIVLIPFERFKPYPRYDVGELVSKPAKNSVQDNKIGWKMKGNAVFSVNTSEFKSTYHANSQGFRSPEFNLDDNRKKIVLIGDSYTYGTFVNYDETFGSIIDNNPNVVVYNLAMPGFGVDQMLLTLQHYGKDLKPDLVIVGLCNADFERSLTAYRYPEHIAKPVFTFEEGELRLKTVNDQTNGLIRFLDRHSRFYAGFKLMCRLLGYRFPIGKWWHLNHEIIDKINKIGHDNNFKILYVYLPTRSWRNFPMLEKHMKKNNYNFINIRKAKIDNPLELYYKTDPHFNPAGHNFVANEIQKFIDSNLDWCKQK